MSRRLWLHQFECTHIVPRSVSYLHTWCNAFLGFESDFFWWERCMPLTVAMKCSMWFSAHQIDASFDYWKKKFHRHKTGRKIQFAHTVHAATWSNSLLACRAPERCFTWMCRCHICECKRHQKCNHEIKYANKRWSGAAQERRWYGEPHNRMEVKVNVYGISRSKCTWMRWDGIQLESTMLRADFIFYSIISIVPASILCRHLCDSICTMFSIYDTVSTHVLHKIGFPFSATI